MFIYFDTQDEIFIFTKTKKSEKSDNRYIRLPDSDLYELAKKNISNIKNYISRKNLLTSFFYHSTKEIKKINIPTNNKKSLSIYNKPNGLWLSCGSSWLEYVNNKYKIANKFNLFSYTYKIDLYDTVKVISDKDELFKFIKKYKRKPDDIRLYDVIDWELVKKDFDGLIITPNLKNKLWREASDEFYIVGAESAHDYFSDLLGPKWKNNMLLLSEWYRSWECDGGVIWDASAIASFELIKKSDYIKYLI